MKEHYNKIYEYNSWKYGSGFLAKREKGYIKFLEAFLLKADIETIVDFGCGDWQIMRHVKLPEKVKYIGLDISDYIIQKNNKKYAIPGKIEFVALDENYLEQTQKFKADLLIVKNVLELWPTSNIQEFLSNILPHYKYALFKTKYNPKNTNENIEINISDRPLNLMEFKYPDLSEIKLTALTCWYPYQAIYFWKHSPLAIKEEGIFLDIDNEFDLLSTKFCINPSKLTQLISGIKEIKKLIDSSFDSTVFQNSCMDYNFAKDKIYMDYDLKKDYRTIIINKKNNNNRHYFVFHDNSKNELILEGFINPQLLTITDSIMNNYSIIIEEDFKIMVTSSITLHSIKDAIKVRPKLD
jgi:hypothetical protein